jgi:hypothetical protein
MVGAGDSDHFRVTHPTLECRMMKIAYKTGPHHSDFYCFAHGFLLSCFVQLQTLKVLETFRVYEFM